MASRLDALRKLRALCQVSHKTAGAALKTSGGDVQNALRALIIAGKVGRFQLDPRRCTDEHFAWAEIRQSIHQREVMPRSHRRWFREKRPTNVLRKQLHGKEPLDKTSMSLGAFYRQLYLRSKYPELAKKTPALTWRHPRLGRFKCDHDEDGMEGSILVPGFKAFGSPRFSGKLSLIFPRQETRQHSHEAAGRPGLKTPRELQTACQDYLPRHLARFSGPGPEDRHVVAWPS